MVFITAHSIFQIFIWKLVCMCILRHFIDIASFIQIANEYQISYRFDKSDTSSLGSSFTNCSVPYLCKYYMYVHKIWSECAQYNSFCVCKVCFQYNKDSRLYHVIWFCTSMPHIYLWGVIWTKTTFCSISIFYWYYSNLLHDKLSFLHFIIQTSLL